MSAPAYADFVVGNVLTETLPAMMGRLLRVGYAAEFDTGLRRRAGECEFWAFSGGTQAGRQGFFEHGRSDTTVALPQGAKFDNRPAWDHVGSKFDNRPS